MPTISIEPQFAWQAPGWGRRQSEPNPYVGDLQWRLQAALEHARGIDIHAIECELEHNPRLEYLQAVRAVVEDAIVVLDAVLGYYERNSEIDAPDSSGLFHRVFEDLIDACDASHPYQRVADVAFMARWELVRKLDALAHAERLGHWELLAAAGSALRRVVKALSGVERVLAQVEQRPSQLQDLFLSQTAEAVLTRQAYVRLLARLHEIQALRSRSSGNRCMRLIGIALATLIGDEIYGALRIEDHRVLRSLQQRVIAWLRAPGEASPHAGLRPNATQHELDADRLLGDACALGSLLLQVNRRSELIEHDCRLLEQLLAELERPELDKLDTYERLITIRGRDGELDALLGDFAELAQWREPAERVLEQLRGRGAAS